MKKSTLLSLLTAGAVIATSAGTFAAWDQTKGSTNPITVNYGEPVITTVNSTKTETEKLSSGFDGVTEANIPFTVKASSLPDGHNTVNFSASGENDAALTGIEVEFYNAADGDANQPTGSPITSATLTTANTDQAYIAKVKLTSESIAANTKPNNLTDKIVINAELQ